MLYRYSISSYIIVGGWSTSNYRYEAYAHNNSWKFEVIDITETSLRGYKVVSKIMKLYFFVPSLFYNNFGNDALNIKNCL
jgi:hypothetical protein